MRVQLCAPAVSGNARYRRSDRAPAASHRERDARPHHPVAVAREATRQLGRLYRLLGARHALVQEVFEGEHEVSLARTPDWFARRLGE